MNSRQNFNKKEQNRSNVNQHIIHRKGHVPDWVDEQEDEDDIFNDAKTLRDSKGIIKIKEENKIFNNDKNINARVSNFLEKEKIVSRRQIHKTEIINDKVNSNVEVLIIKPNVESVDVASMREIMKRKLLENNQNKIKDNKEDNKEDEDELMELIGNDEENNIEECNKQNIQNYNNQNQNISDEEENEDSDSNQDEILLRPVFVTKEERKTINEEMKRESEENELLERQEFLKEQKRKQTKEIVKKYIEEDENKQNQEVKEETEDTDLPDDTDDLDNLEEYEKWKLRELRRIKIQFEEDEKKIQEKSEIERRRNLSDEQRKEENLRLGSDDTLKNFKSKINFLAKYYHKGAFYQSDAKEDTSHVLNRDYNLPTAADKVDRSVMPKSLQVRRGLEHKKGRSKYTHLTAEDTTNFDPNYKISDNITNKYMSNLGGYKGQNNFELTNRKRNKN